MAERLEDAGIQRFLATKEVVVLTTVQPDGSPLATPVWFLHGPDALTLIAKLIRRRSETSGVTHGSVSSPRPGPGRTYEASSSRGVPSFSPSHRSGTHSPARSWKSTTRTLGVGGEAV